MERRVGTLTGVRRRICSLAVIAVVALGAGACGGGGQRPKLARSRPAAPATTTTTAIPVHLVAAVKPELKTINVYADPTAPTPKEHLSNPTGYNAPRVF